jgi:hypothetical protein
MKYPLNSQRGKPETRQRRIHEAATALWCRASAGLMMDARDGPAFLHWFVVAGANREDAAFMNN